MDKYIRLLQAYVGEHNIILRRTLLKALWRHHEKLHNLVRPQFNNIRVAQTRPLMFRLLLDPQLNKITVLDSTTTKY